MIAEPRTAPALPVPTDEPGHSDALREIERKLEACADEVQYRIHRASEALESARTAPAENAAWSMSEEADRMDNVLAELQEAPLAFWRDHLDRSAWELLQLPAEAIERYACEEWLHGTSGEEAERV
jgi:hypothetical protein